MLKYRSFVGLFALSGFLLHLYISSIILTKIVLFGIVWFVSIALFPAIILYIADASKKLWKHYFIWIWGVPTAIFFVLVIIGEWQKNPNTIITMAIFTIVGAIMGLIVCASVKLVKKID